MLKFLSRSPLKVVVSRRVRFVEDENVRHFMISVRIFKIAHSRNSSLCLFFVRLVLCSATRVLVESARRSCKVTQIMPACILTIQYSCEMCIFGKCRCKDSPMWFGTPQLEQRGLGIPAKDENGTICASMCTHGFASCGLIHIMINLMFNR